MPSEQGSPDAVRAAYSRHGTSWQAQRSLELFERGWLDRFRAALPPGGRVLDLGCGAGMPISAHLIAAGHPVTGVDFAEPLLEAARRDFPAHEWIAADMRGLDLGRRFDGIVAWDSFFHLSRADQRAMFPVFARHLAAGGPLMFTSGPSDGERCGTIVPGVPIYHASLSPAAYAACIEAAGLRVSAFVAEDPGCRGHSVWLARRSTAP